MKLLPFEHEHCPCPKCGNADPKGFHIAFLKGTELFLMDHGLDDDQEALMISCSVCHYSVLTETADALKVPPEGRHIPIPEKPYAAPPPVSLPDDPWGCFVPPNEYGSNEYGSNKYGTKSRPDCPGDPRFPRIIGFCGKKGAGKDFVSGILSRMLKERGRTVTLIAFADPIKRFCQDALGIGSELLWADNYKKEFLTRFRWGDFPDWVMEGPVGERAGMGKLSVREVVQLVGTEFGRKVWGEDIWTKAMEWRIDKIRSDYILITDVRFPDEADMIRKYGGNVISVQGRGIKGDSHSSETSIDKIVPDAIITNGKEDDASSLTAKMNMILLAFYEAV